MAQTDPALRSLEKIGEAGAGWAGESLSSSAAMERMKHLADIVENYQYGGILFLFSRKKWASMCNARTGFYGRLFNCLHRFGKLYGLLFSYMINEENIMEIECGYGLNEYPDDNPWGGLYDGCKVSAAMGYGPN